MVMLKEDKENSWKWLEKKIFFSNPVHAIFENDYAGFIDLDTH